MDSFCNSLLTKLLRKYYCLYNSLYIIDWELSIDNSGNDSQVHEKLKGKSTIAIQNVQRTEDYCRKTGYTYHKHDFAPSTDAHKAVKDIRGD